MIVRPVPRVVWLAAFVATAVTLSAQLDPATTSIAARFAKHEYDIAMRDGVTLHTVVYVPRTIEEGGAGPRTPILLMRTPYGIGPYGADTYPDSLGPSPAFDDGRFVVVHQDVRGRFMSGGTWVEMRPLDAAARGSVATDESTDAWDTIDWLVRHVPGNNGRVGVWGISYPGFYAACSLVGAHPALAAVSPQAPVADYYMGDDAYHNGAFMLAANFGFYAGFYPRGDQRTTGGAWRAFEYGTEDGYAFFLGMGALRGANAKYLSDGNTYWDEVVAHPTYDAFWRARAVPPHLVGIRPAVLTVGGWYDAEDLQGPLRIYRQIEESTPRALNRLVMGPWTHGAWARGAGRQVGPIDLGSDTAAFYRENIEEPFFARALLSNEPEREPESWAFETGHNAWHRLDSWPPAGTSPATFYFAGGGRLVARAPAEAGEPFDEYVSDPANPVPFIAAVPPLVPGDWMSYDQAFAATRRDVLVYRGDPLDRPLTIAGPIDVTLYVSTTGTDADFVVKLVDESPADADPGGSALPAGFQRLVRGEPFRGRFRRSFEHPEPFRPGEPDTIAFSMPDVFHTFERGHRVVVHVQSTWFPLVDRNPQTLVDIATATSADFRVATERVYRSRDRASSVTVGVVGREGLRAEATGGPGAGAGLPPDRPSVTRAP